MKNKIFVDLDGKLFFNSLETSIKEAKRKASLYFNCKKPETYNNFSYITPNGIYVFSRINNICPNGLIVFGKWK